MSLHQHDKMLGYIVGYRKIQNHENGYWDIDIILKLRGWIVKSAEHCGADYKPLDR